MRGTAKNDEAEYTRCERRNREGDRDRHRHRHSTRTRYDHQRPCSFPLAPPFFLSRVAARTLRTRLTGDVRAEGRNSKTRPTHLAGGISDGSRVTSCDTGLVGGVPSSGWEDEGG